MKKHTRQLLDISCLVALCTTPISQAQTKDFFSDVTQSPYKEAIYHLQEQKIVGGYDDGTFRPEQLINRAEFLKIIIGSLYPEEVQQETLKTNCFEDIQSPDIWYVPYACLAKEKGIIDGYEGKFLRPENTINLVETAKIIANSYSPDPFYTENIEPWFKPYMQYLINNKLLPPTLTQFEQILNRGAMAELISREIRLKDQKLEDYLAFRKSNYGESTFLSWEEMSGELPSKTSPETIIDAYNIPRYNRQIVDTPHPGQYVESGYLQNYQQWTSTSYEPSVENQSLSLEMESKLREELFGLINEARREKGVHELTFNDILNNAAQNFVEHLVINAFYSHMDKWGKEPDDRTRELGYKNYTAEGMVWRKRDMQEAINWWKSSPMHWNNITNARYNNVGIGITEEPGGGYLIILVTGE